MQKQRKYSETEMIVVNAYWRLKMRAKKNECVCTLYSAVASPLAISILFSINVVPYDIALGSCFSFFFSLSSFFFLSFHNFHLFLFLGFGVSFIWTKCDVWWLDGWMVELPTTTITTTATLFWFLCVAEWICHFAGVQNGCDSCRVIFSIIDLSDFRRLTIHFTPQSLTHGMSSFQIIRHRNCHQHRHCCSHLMGGCILHTAYCMCTHSHPHTYTVRIVQCTFYGHCVVYFGFPLSLSYSSPSSLSPFKCIDLAKWENQIFVCVFFAFCKH